MTPPELIEAAVNAGLTAIALTDHDTTSGIAEFLRVASRRGIIAIPGVEISTSHAPGEMHILGYYVDHRDIVFAQQLEWIRSARRARNEEIFHKLHKLGMHLTWHEIYACAGGDEVVGRPHFAQVMMNRGYVRSTKEAFKRYLTRGCPAYARRRTIEPADALGMIHDAGGLPVLAHPFTMGLNRGETRRMLYALRDWGLEGIEVFYVDHDAARQELYMKYADELNLVPTGGTDFHGARTPDIKLGSGFGGLRVPHDTVTRLETRRRELGYTQRERSRNTRP